MNMPLLAYAADIPHPVLMIHGEKAHSRYFGEDAFKKLTGDNKELLIIPGANQTNLYDDRSVIPFDKIEEFFKKNLNYIKVISRRGRFSPRFWRERAPRRATRKSQ